MRTLGHETLGDEHVRDCCANQCSAALTDKQPSNNKRLVSMYLGNQQYNKVHVQLSSNIGSRIARFALVYFTAYNYKMDTINIFVVAASGLISPSDTIAI